MNNTTKLLFKFLLIFFLFGTGVFAGEQGDVDENIKHAETYCQLGMKDRGNVRDFEKALQCLEKAKGNTSSLKKEIEGQLDKARGTFFGNFPLVRLLVPTLFIHPDAAGLYEAVYMPEAAAVEDALEMLCAKMKTPARIPTVVTSLQGDKRLESEARYFLNSLGKFDLKNRQMESPGSVDVLLVSIEEIDKVDKNYRYEVTGKLFKAGKSEPDFQLSITSFSRDRRGMKLPLVICHVILFILAVVIFMIFAEDKNKTFFTNMLIPVVAFLFGRILPWILTPIITAIRPAAETPVLLSLWWPLLAAAVLLAGPSLVYYGKIHIVDKKFDLPRLNAGPGILFICISFGVSAYIAGPLFLYSGKTEILKLLLFVAGNGVLSYILGCTLNKNHPLPISVSSLALVSAAVLGAAIFSFDLFYLFAALVLSFISISSTFFKKKEGSKPGSQQSTGTLPLPGIPNTTSRLAAKAGKPFHVPCGEFESAYEIAYEGFGEKITVLGLTGNMGAGKTITAEEIISQLKRDKGRIEVIAIKCLEESTQLAPFAPVMEAVKKYTVGNKDLEQVNAALKLAIDNFLPFFKWLSPGAGEGNPAAPELQEFKVLTKGLLEQLTPEYSVVLFIDNIQWLDDESGELLDFLLNKFAADQPVPILFILSGRDKEQIELIFQEHRISLGHIIHLEDPGEEKQRRILTGGLGLHREVAGEIIKNIGAAPEKQKTLHWLFLTVIHLAQRGAFSFVEGRFQWHPGFGAGSDKVLPIPSELKELLKQNLRDASEYYNVLECAACIGFQYDLDTLACCLEVSPFSLLKQLSLLETETGIITDKRDGKNTFEFKSPFIYGVIREEFDVKSEGPEGEVRQIIREYHSRAAACLEQGKDFSPQTIAAIAHHYYAAGEKQAGKSVEFCLKAAHECCRLYRFDQAYEFLEKTRECAIYLQLEMDFDEDELMVKLNDAFIRGRDREAITNEGLKYVKANKSAPIRLVLLVVQACYNMGPEERQYFSEAVDLAKDVLTRTRNPEEQAEAHQYIGLSLAYSEEDERKSNFTKAIKILDGISSKSSGVQLLLARIYDSLARELTFTEIGKEKEKAVTLYNKSIEIKESAEIVDLAGLARSYGGLGQLYLEWNRNAHDIKKAEEFFAKDLELSLQLDDLPGQIKMHSFLGQCHITRGKNIAEAEAHYSKSLELADKIDSQNDRFFALIGLLEVYCISDRAKKIEKTDKTIIKLLESGFHIHDNDRIQQVLNKHGDRLNSLKGIVDKCSY